MIRCLKFVDMKLSLITNTCTVVISLCVETYDS